MADSRARVVTARRRSGSSPAPARFLPTLRKRAAATWRVLASVQTRPWRKATETAKRNARSHLADFPSRSRRARPTPVHEL
jgi:hypothetical protein